MNITHTLEVIRDRESQVRSKIASINEQNMLESVDDRFTEVESLLSKETVGDYMEANDTIKQMDDYMKPYKEDVSSDTGSIPNRTSFKFFGVVNNVSVSTNLTQSPIKSIEDREKELKKNGNSSNINDSLKNMWQKEIDSQNSRSGKDGALVDQMKKALETFVKNSERISDSIENRFCKDCNKLNNDPKFSNTKEGEIRRYKDLRNLRITDVCIKYDERGDFSKGKIILCIAGEYDIDPEHGFSVAFINGHPVQYKRNNGYIINQANVAIDNVK